MAQRRPPVDNPVPILLLKGFRDPGMGIDGPWIGSRSCRRACSKSSWSCSSRRARSVPSRSPAARCRSVQGWRSLTEPWRARPRRSWKIGRLSHPDGSTSALEQQSRPLEHRARGTYSSVSAVCSKRRRHAHSRDRHVDVTLSKRMILDAASHRHCSCEHVHDADTLDRR